MPLTTPVSGATIFASDIVQLVQVLQQPSGGSEVLPAVFYETGSFQTSATVGQWFTTRSQGSVPGSASTGSTTLSNMGSLSTQSLGSAGVFVSGAASGAGNTTRFTTTITVNY